MIPVVITMSALAAMVGFLILVRIIVDWYERRHVYKVNKRFYGYHGAKTHEELMFEVRGREQAEKVAQNITDHGKSADGRIDYDGVVR